MPLSAGTRLSHYEIISAIGKGGMGEVYRATDTRLGRQVAIKVLPLEFSRDPVRVQRFLREARLAASLTHPNIVSLFEIGEVEGVHFLAMECLEGCTLRDQLKGSPLGLGRALRIGRQVAEALSVAHAAGIVHRDIKPENIFLLAGDHVKVLDFGLASRDLSLGGIGLPSSGAEVTVTQLTVAGHVMGTLKYMSTEQMRGKPLDGRSDLFSVGIVLYEMLAGEHPFEAEVAVDSMQRLLSEQPESLSARNEQVPYDVEAIVFSCLEKDAEIRCPSATHLTAVLTQAERREWSSGSLAAWDVAETVILPGSAVPRESARSGARANQSAVRSTALSSASSSTPSAPPSAPDSTQPAALSAKPARIAWARWVAATALALAVIAGAAVWFAGRSTEVHSLAILPFVNESGDASLAYIAEGIPESIQRDLSGASGLRLAPRTASGQLPQNLRVQAVMSGTMRRSDGAIEVAVRLTGEGGKDLWHQTYRRPPTELIGLEEAISGDLATRIRVQTVPQKHAANANAYDLYLKGRHRLSVRTIDDLRQAILYFQQATAISPDFALAWAGTGEAYALIANFGTQAPRASLAQAKAASLRALELDPTIAEAHTSYGFALAFSDHKLVEAERSLRRAIELDPTHAEPHSYLAVAVLTPLKRFDEATIEIQRARDIAPSSGILRLVQLNVLYLARRYDAALELIQRADPGFLPAEFSLEKALDLTAIGKPLDAIAAIQTAVPDISEKWLRNGAGLDQTQLTLLGALAYARSQAGQSAEADRLEEFLDQQSRQTYVSQCGLALIDVSRKRRDSAFRRIAQCVEDRDFESLFLQVEPRYDPIRSDPRFLGLDPSPDMRLR
jgi:serine/threonine protein kinase/tetratricopeptide (TPR) repeat protein